MDPPVQSKPAPVVTPPAQSPPAPSTPDEGRFVPGTLVAGRYRIISLLGRGGMGEVYRGTDLTLSQPVALKFLHEGSGPHARAGTVPQRSAGSAPGIPSERLQGLRCRRSGRD